MKEIRIYDDDMEIINDFCEANDMSHEEFIMELLADFMEEHEEAKHR